MYENNVKITPIPDKLYACVPLGRGGENIKAFLSTGLHERMLDGNVRGVEFMRGEVPCRGNIDNYIVVSLPYNETTLNDKKYNFNRLLWTKDRYVAQRYIPSNDLIVEQCPMGYKVDGRGKYLGFWYWSMPSMRMKDLHLSPNDLDWRESVGSMQCRCVLYTDVFEKLTGCHLSDEDKDRISTETNDRLFFQRLGIEIFTESRAREIVLECMRDMNLL